MPKKGASINSNDSAGGGQSLYFAYRQLAVSAKEGSQNIIQGNFITY